MPSYSPWAWSEENKRHYCAYQNDDGSVIEYIWSGAASTPTTTTPAAVNDPSRPRTVGPEPSSLAGSSYGVSSTATHNNYYSPQSYSSPEPQSRPSATHGHSSYGGASYPSYGTGSSSARQPQQYPSTSQSLTQASTPLPQHLQDAVKGDKQRRVIKTGNDGYDAERLDPRYRRVTAYHYPYFFITGKVFKMLWVEPAGQVNPGKTRGSTHFSTISYGETAYSEIRRFVVIRNRGSFSQCMYVDLMLNAVPWRAAYAGTNGNLSPIQTYRRKGATKPGLNVQDHGVIFTGDRGDDPPDLLENEGITKQAIRVDSAAGEVLEAESRINYGKPYAVEHNVKVLEVGQVAPEHIHLLQIYFEDTMRFA
ncbi:hypothetical protein EJ04DRAFT_607477 [Polyplosphaeria fusca]|uniref:DUF6590 domain-containing protein n=1 Tax=Polyplosphaeria fusca TaxID=682080 RepID=A0A9P4QWI8_9PLEO|nr:hypothetical protein EJ04DRAFT_607477 [Polyplosphaeria fusca]